MSQALCATTLAITVTAVSACSSSGGGGGGTTSPAGTPSSSASSSTLFGPDCAKLGITPQEAAQAKNASLAQVVGKAPFLKTVVGAATSAHLTAALNAAPAVTVFAPTNAAFAKAAKTQLKKLLTDPKQRPQLLKTLEYHVVQGKLSQAQLPGKHTTLAGTPLTIAGSGGNFTINGSTHIVCGGLETKNAAIEMIDGVLQPK